jgi:hypothetical protein
VAGGLMAIINQMPGECPSRNVTGTRASETDRIDNDWLVNFFDKYHLISDEEMQNLWGRRPADEANKPGKFSKRSMGFSSSFDKPDATSCQELCSFNCWLMGGKSVNFRFSEMFA